MPTDQHKQTVRRFYEAVGDIERQVTFLSPQLVDHAFPTGIPQGIEGFRQLAGAFTAAFPDLKVTVDGLIGEGDEVSVRWTARATHQGELMGIRPTGRRVTWTGIDVHRFANGQIVEHWGEWDQLGLLQQLGAVQAPAPFGG